MQPQSLSTMSPDAASSHLAEWAYQFARYLKEEMRCPMSSEELHDWAYEVYPARKHLDPHAAARAEWQAGEQRDSASRG